MYHTGKLHQWEGKPQGVWKFPGSHDEPRPYSYDILYPNRAVALHPCVYNQSSRRGHDLEGTPSKGLLKNQCREYPRPPFCFANHRIEHSACDDCRAHPVEKTKTGHCTACKKPWESMYRSGSSSFLLANDKSTG